MTFLEDKISLTPIGLNELEIIVTQKWINTINQYSTVQHCTGFCNLITNENRI